MSLADEPGGMLTQSGFADPAPTRWDDKLFVNRIQRDMVRQRVDKFAQKVQRKPPLALKGGKPAGGSRPDWR